MSLLPQPQGPLDPFASDQKLERAAIVPRKFWIKYKPVLEYVEVNGKTIAKETDKLRAEEWVEWDKKLTGSQTIAVSCVDSVERIKKGAKRATEPDDEKAAIWRVMEPYYKNWKSGGTDEVIDGTPLAVWPGVTREVVELLKPFRILSVEDLSMIGDQLMQKLPDPHMATYRSRAKKFLETKDIAKAVRELDQKDTELVELRAMVEKLQKAQADSDRRANDAEKELDEATPAPARKRRARAEATA